MSDQSAYPFHIHGFWAGGSEEGAGSVIGSGGEIAMHYPVHLGGDESKTNPEELLMKAVAACYVLTFVAIAERRRIPVERVEISVDGEVIRQPGGTLKFTSMQLRPKITLKGADEAQRATAEDLSHKADLYCPISNAIRGNVELSLNPEIVNS